MPLDGLSIIICCYNARERIIPALEALQKQVDPGFPWELVIVDNASTDGTGDIALQTWAKNPVAPINVVREEKPGLIHARHKGLETARYEILSFIDDDNWVEDHWVIKVMEVFNQDPAIAACGGQAVGYFEKNEPAWFARYSRSFAVGKQRESSGYVEKERGFLWGAGLSLRKSLWIRLRGTGYQNLTVGRQGKSMMAGEDSELCFAFRLMGYRLYYRDDLLLQHYMPDGRMRFPYLLAMTYGFGLAQARLNCYRVLLDPGFKFHSWWYEWLAAQKKKLGISARLLSPGKKEKEELQVERAFFSGYARQLWRDKNKLKQFQLILKQQIDSITP